MFSGIHEGISLASIEPSTLATVFWRFICSQCFLEEEEEEESCPATPEQECPATEACVVQCVDFHGTTHPIARRARNAAQRIATQRKPRVAAWGANVHSAGLLRHPFVHVPFAFVHKCTPIPAPPPRVFLPVFRCFFFLSAARGGCNLSQCLEVFSANRLERISCHDIVPRRLVRLKLRNDRLVNPSQNARRYVIAQSFVPKSLEKNLTQQLFNYRGGWWVASGPFYDLAWLC